MAGERGYLCPPQGGPPSTAFAGKVGKAVGVDAAVLPVQAPVPQPLRDRTRAQPELRGLIAPCCAAAIEGASRSRTPVGRCASPPEPRRDCERCSRLIRAIKIASKGTIYAMTLESRDRWVRAAEGWEAQADKFGKDSMPVSARMIEAIAPAAGARRSSTWRPGIGDTGYPGRGADPARRDADHERLRARDARRRAATGGARGITNVRFRQIDLSVPIDQPAASPRRRPVPLGLHAAQRPRVRAARHATDPQAGRARWRSPPGPARTTTSGARRPCGSCRRAAILEKPARRAWPVRLGRPGRSSPTRWRPRASSSPQIEAVDFQIHYDDVDDWWVAQTQMSARTGDADKADGLRDEKRRPGRPGDGRRALLQPDDRLMIPARTWVATATA